MNYVVEIKRALEEGRRKCGTNIWKKLYMNAFQEVLYTLRQDLSRQNLFFLEMVVL